MLPLIVGIESTVLSAVERELFSRLQPAGYILFSRNIESRDQCLLLCDSLYALHQGTLPPIIAIDQEGGRVVRTSILGLELPSAQQLGATRDFSLITEAAHVNALSLAALGINTNFAPVLDASSPHSNALSSRCWGSSSDEIISYAGVWNREHRRMGIMSCAKHFPGMGEAQVDPHFELPILRGNRDHFLRSAALPFLSLMPELPSLMLAHLSLPELDHEYPSSLSAAIIKGFLREQLGYTGLIFTDDLCMDAIKQNYGLAKAAHLALEAGCDLPLLCHDVLSHLEEVAQQLSKLRAECHDQIMARLQNYCRAMPRSINYRDHLYWKSLLRRASRLCSELNSQHDKGESQSPVFAY